MQKRDALSALKDGMVFDLFIFYIFYDKKLYIATLINIVVYTILFLLKKKINIVGQLSNSLSF